MDKTKVLFFQGRRPNPIYRPVFCLNNKEITHTSNVKFLDTYITDKLGHPHSIFKPKAQQGSLFVYILT
jgi:hypothetical protein